MPPSVLVIEVVSPGQTNHERDHEDKHTQYQAQRIEEYWLLDLEQQVVTVLSQVDRLYREDKF